MRVIVIVREAARMRVRVLEATIAAEYCVLMPLSAACAVLTIAVRYCENFLDFFDIQDSFR